MTSFAINNSDFYSSLLDDSHLTCSFPFQTVLSTCLPWLASQTNLFQTTLSLREGIARVYDELRDEELNNEKDLVLAHRLVSHSFICELLRASCKFTSKNMADLLRSILKGENDEMT